MREFAFALLPLLFFTQAAHAHLMPAGHGGIRVDGSAAMALVSVPVAALSGWDDDHNGRLSLVELNAHRPQLEQQINTRFRLEANGTPGNIVFQDLLFSDMPNEGITGAERIVIMRRTLWDKPVATLNVHLDLFTPAGQDAEISLNVIRGTESEMAILNAGRTDHHYFRGPLSVFADAVRTGAEHILLGYDHLLFLLTLLVAGAGWRYWAVTITAFTVAHSITLALAVFNIVRVSPAIVEPLIAASIVLMAADNLIRGRTDQNRQKHRAWLVFGCGLLHGLGIASALIELGMQGAGRILTLAGFNIGVELGQFLFVGITLALFAAVRRAAGEPIQYRLAQACSVAAVLIGCGWVVTRIINPGS